MRDGAFVTTAGGAANQRTTASAPTVGRLELRLCGLVLLGTVAMAAPSGSEMGGAKVNVNTASAAELASLPGIGPSKAQAIVEHRAKEPFTRAEDLRKVKGIGPKLYDAIREQITVGDTPAPSGRGG